MSKDKLLIVDDIAMNREILIEYLGDSYDIVEASDGIEALEAVKREGDSLSLILLDIMMPRMDGFEVVEILKKDGYTEKVPVIFQTAAGSKENEIRGLNSGAVDFIEKPFSPGIIKSRVATHVELTKHRRHLEKMVEENVQKIVVLRDSMIDTIASVIEYRDMESGRHVERTKYFAYKLMKLVERSGLLAEEMEKVDIDLVTKAIPLHDVGKIGIPDRILLKPGKLTMDEFEVMKQHTMMGANIISAISAIGDPEYLRYCREIALYHHEHWGGGGGYPNGLKGNQIPLPARVMAIVDVFDALTSSRVYKPAYSKETCLSIMRKDVGMHFDPIIAKVFIENYEAFAYLYS